MILHFYQTYHVPVNLETVKQLSQQKLRLPQTPQKPVTGDCQVA